MIVSRKLLAIAAVILTVDNAFATKGRNSRQARQMLRERGMNKLRATNDEGASSSATASSSNIQPSATAAANAAVNSQKSNAAAQPVDPVVASTADDWALQHDFSGNDFWDHWMFLEGNDPTRGMVNYLNRDAAFDAGLAGTTSSGSNFLRVDNYTDLPAGAYRNSVRIYTKERITYPSMVIMDANHLAYGKTTWPAFWMIGDTWPTGGELDIIEGTNLQLVNQMGAHTKPGCTLSTPMPLKATGAVLTTDCDALIQSNTGCVVRDISQASYGKGFNDAGGGVYATVWDKVGLSIYFFPRDEVPENIYNGNPDPSTWGSPSAVWASGDCAPSEFFTPQIISFDITICGDWAKSTWGSEYGYPGECMDQVSNKTNYDTAIFDVNFVHVYHGVSDDA